MAHLKLDSGFIQQIDLQTSGHSYKHFTIINYDSRNVIWAKL